MWWGGLSFLSEDHFFHAKLGMGRGTNNLAELLALKAVLVYALDKGCDHLQVYGDSLLVVNWINARHQC